MKSKEAQLQAQCVKWFRLKYPKYARLLFAVPNGGSRNPLEARNMKLQGVLAGVSDLILLKPNSKYPFLCIEMKAGSNRQTDTQKIFQHAIEQAGGKYIVCYSFEEFFNFINKYLNEK